VRRERERESGSERERELNIDFCNGVFSVFNLKFEDDEIGIQNIKY
jgi:hypothetical protein